MKNKNTILFLLLFLPALCGCIRHIPPERIIPTAAPEIIVVKTPSAKQSRPKQAEDAANLWTLCQSVGNSDSPETLLLSAMQPQELRERIMMQMEIQPEDQEAAIISLRCMGGKLLVCDSARYSQCIEKVDTSTTPTDVMINACKEADMEGAVLPAAVTGRGTAFEWICINGAPAISRQDLIPDPQGYNPNIWYEIPQPDQP